MMISFKFGLSLFVVTLVSQCLALPIEKDLELTTYHSSSVDPKSPRGFLDQTFAMSTSYPSVHEPTWNSLATPQSKRNVLLDEFLETTTYAESETRVPRTFPELTTFHTEPITTEYIIPLVSRHHEPEHRPMSSSESHSWMDSGKPEDVSSPTLSTTPASSDNTQKALQDMHRNGEKGDYAYEKRQTFEPVSGIKPAHMSDEQFSGDSNVPVAQYDASDSKLGNSAPTNQLLLEENNAAIVEFTSSSTSPIDSLVERENTPDKSEPILLDATSSTFEPTEGTQKRHDVPVKEDTTSSTFEPTEGTQKRHDVPVKEDSTFAPTEGTQKREVMPVKEDPTSSTFEPTEGTQKRHDVPVKEDSTFAPTEGTQKRHDVPVKEDSTFAPTEATQKRESKPVKEDSTSSTFKPNEVAVEWGESSSKDEKPVDESQKNSPVLDQGKNSPGIKKEESHH